MTLRNQTTTQSGISCHSSYIATVSSRNLSTHPTIMHAEPVRSRIREHLCQWGSRHGSRGPSSCFVTSQESSITARLGSIRLAGRRFGGGARARGFVAAQRRRKSIVANSRAPTAHITPGRPARRVSDRRPHTPGTHRAGSESMRYTLCALQLGTHSTPRDSGASPVNGEDCLALDEATDASGEDRGRFSF